MQRPLGRIEQPQKVSKWQAASGKLASPKGVKSEECDGSILAIVSSRPQ
jgi:hypothetical protein